MPTCIALTDNTCVQHYFAPTVDWTIAVSRRFHGAKSVLLYRRAVLPVLERHGTVVECQYASDDRYSSDYWVRRINTILSVTDIHVLIDIDSSGYVEYEFDISAYLAHSHQPIPPAMLPYWQPGPMVSVLKPRRILITDRHARYSYSRLKKTFSIGVAGLTVEAIQKRLNDALLNVKRRRNWFLRQGLRLIALLPKSLLIDEPAAIAVAEDAYHVALALAAGTSVPALEQLTTLRASRDYDTLLPDVMQLIGDAENWHLGLRTGAVAVPAELHRRWLFMSEFFRDYAARLLGEEVREKRLFRFVTAVLGLAAALSRSRCRALISHVATPSTSASQKVSRHPQ